MAHISVHMILSSMPDADIVSKAVPGLPGITSGALYSGSIVLICLYTFKRQTSGSTLYGPQTGMVILADPKPAPCHVPCKLYVAIKDALRSA